MSGIRSHASGSKYQVSVSCIRYRVPCARHRVTGVRYRHREPSIRCHSSGIRCQESISAIKLYLQVSDSSIRRRASSFRYQVPVLRYQVSSLISPVLLCSHGPVSGAPGFCSTVPPWSPWSHGRIRNITSNDGIGSLVGMLAEMIDPFLCSRRKSVLACLRPLRIEILG